MNDKRYLNDEVELWKEKRYYEKVIIDYYSTNEIYPDVANRIVDGLTKFMNIAELQQQEIEHLREDLASWEAGLNQTKEIYELQRQLQQAQAKIERYEKALENILISPFPLDIDDAVAIAKQALLEESE